ncbi:MAG: hypothetical protein AAF362_17210 [Pseudomonadota bacterium]
MATRKAVLKEVDLPDFGSSSEMPELADEIYRARFSRLMDRASNAGLDILVVYADREHSANLAWMSGFDPRFEEALMIARKGRQPVLLTGPENQGPAKASPLDFDVRLYPPFGLLGQERSHTRPLAEILSEAGVKPGLNIGICGWKYFSEQEFDSPETTIEIPAYIVETISELGGTGSRISNAGAIFMDPSNGLRATMEIDELARFEFAACHTSEAVKRVVFGARPGMSEFEAASLIRPIGLPLSCHTMMSSGERAWFGLLSPTSRILEKGDAITTAYGVQGALNCRAGWLANDEGDLPESIRDYIDVLVRPYFEAVANWLETVGIGITGGELFAGIEKRIGDPFFGVGLNPGHLIHLDEWMNSPIYNGSLDKLQSGMALQVDVIPATGGPYFTTNMEDGIILLDDRGRAEFADKYPDAADRIATRRAFMRDRLGIALKPEVLPMSNLASFLPPFWLSPDRAMVLE